MSSLSPSRSSYCVQNLGAVSFVIKQSLVHGIFIIIIFSFFFFFFFLLHLLICTFLLFFFCFLFFFSLSSFSSFLHWFCFFFSLGVKHQVTYSFFFSFFLSFFPPCFLSFSLSFFPFPSSINGVLREKGEKNPRKTQHISEYTVGSVRQWLHLVSCQNSAHTSAFTKMLSKSNMTEISPSDAPLPNCFETAATALSRRSIWSIFFGLAKWMPGKVFYLFVWFVPRAKDTRMTHIRTYT